MHEWINVNYNMAGSCKFYFLPLPLSPGTCGHVCYFALLPFHDAARRPLPHMDPRYWIVQPSQLWEINCSLQIFQSQVRWYSNTKQMKTPNKQKQS